MGFSKTYDFPAPPEVVFNSLTDPDRVARWLPPGVSLEIRDADRMVIRAGGRRYELKTAADMSAMRLGVHMTDNPDVRGDLAATQAPAGGSQLRVQIDGLDPRLIGARVDEAVAQLHRQVTENFSDG